MLFDQPATLAPATIAEWHGICVAALDNERARILAAYSAGAIQSYSVPSGLLGATKNEVNDYFDSCTQELDLSAVLNLVAAAEARIRLDAEIRKKQAPQCALAGRLAALFAAADKSWGVSLYENGILDAWKDHVGRLTDLSQSDRDRLRGAIGAFKDVLKLRHWVAHGRYWTLDRSIESYPPVSVFRVVSSLYAALDEAARLGGVPLFPCSLTA